MKKSKKVLIIIAVVMIVLLIAAYSVLFILYPEQTKSWTMTAWDWLNKPLPVVGVSTLVVVFFLWKVFVSSSFGKKQLNLFNERTSNVERDFELLKEQYQNTLKELEIVKSKAEEYKGYLVEVCAKSPNKKINQLGEVINGKEREETINNEAEAN